MIPPDNTDLTLDENKSQHLHPKTPACSGGSASIVSCTINLANTMIGAGILGLPGAFQGTGWVTGLVLIAISAAFSAHGLVLLSKAALKTGLPSSFYTVASAVIPRYTMLIDLAVALKCFGVATGYLITVSDCMVDALDHILLTGDPQNDESFVVSLFLSKRFWVAGALLLVLPFSFYKSLNDLKKASALALVFVLLLAAGIVAYSFDVADPCDGVDEQDCKGEVVPVKDFRSTFSKLPIFIFAFTCQQNIFPIVNEIQYRTQERINTVIVLSVGSALILFSVVAFEGYRTYGAYVKGDIVLNYPETAFVTFLRICIAGMLTLHYPLQLDPARRCLTSLVTVANQWWRNFVEIRREHSSAIQPSVDGYYDSDSYTSSLEKGDSPGSNGGNRLFYSITVSFLILSFTLAMFVNDLGIVLALVGATGSTLVSYVLPGLIYVKVHPDKDVSMILGYIQLIIGVLIIPLSLYFVTSGSIIH